jgi:dTDP-4-amino-4,6-dideoxygalactose transaminase
LNVPLLDLNAQYKAIKEEILSATMEVYETQVKYAVGVSSGTDALLIALMSAHIGPGDLVITSPYTFFSTAGSIARLGAVPVFVDIDERTYNIDPERLQEKISSMDSQERSRVKAIIPVHLFGQCAAMGRIKAVADSLGSVMIEDAAQAIGAEWESADGSFRRAGSVGAYGCFSFFPSKNLGSFGISPEVSS